jgi:thioredoxin 1
MGDLYEITNDNFESDVLQADKPVLLEFGAVWCAPCKLLEPALMELAGDWGDDVLVAKVDVDHAPELAQNYQVLSVPTTILFKGGEPLERIVGFKPKEQINEKVSVHF